MNNSNLYVGFCTDKSDWISTAIRWLTWSKFSHVVLVSPCKQFIIEATHGKGVVGGSLLEFVNRDGIELRCISHDNPQAVWDLAFSQIGKAYDWKYIYGWLFRRDWQDPNKWSCSELIAWSACLFPVEFRSRVSPRDIYLVSEALTDSDTLAQRGT